jgi:hypothetical protein
MTKLQLMVRRVNALGALDWFRQSWVLLRQQPRLIGLCWIMYLISFAPVLIHPALAVLANFLNVFLLAGFYQLIANGLAQRPVQAEDLWLAFKQPVLRAVLLRLAAVSVLLAIPVQLAAEPVLTALQSGIQQGGGASGIALSELLLAVSLHFVHTMMFAYAVPVVYFLQQVRIWPALMASFSACWRNVSALGLYGMLAVLLLATGPLTLLLSFVLVLPLLSVSFFMSFRDIFVLTPQTPEQDNSGPQDGTFEV